MPIKTPLVNADGGNSLVFRLHCIILSNDKEIMTLEPCGRDRVWREAPFIVFGFVHCSLVQLSLITRQKKKSYLAFDPLKSDSHRSIDFLSLKLLIMIY